MENLIFSLNVTIPVFLLILIGMFLMKIQLFNESFANVADKYVFKVALPALLFRDIGAMDLKEAFSGKFVLFCAVVTTIMFAGTFLAAKLFIKDKSLTGAFAQAAARGSAAILGVAFVENIYGNSGMTPMMIVASVPLFNIYSVIILTLGAQSESKLSMKANVKLALINIAKNPIILGILAGVIWSLIGIEMPAIMSKTVNSLAVTATPIALLSLGASFKGREALAKLKPSIWATVTKLLLIPAVFIPIAIAMGFRNSELVAILILTGSPTTVSCYVMAKNMQNDHVLTASVVMLATLFSSVTLTFWVFLFKTLGYI